MLHSYAHILTFAFFKFLGKKFLQVITVYALYNIAFYRVKIAFTLLVCIGKEQPILYFAIYSEMATLCSEIYC